MTYVKAIQGPGFSVIYINEKEETFLFSGGTWAWRNHNPGNIRPGEIAHKYGQIGKVRDQRGGWLAVFSTKSDGQKALTALLKTEKYQNKTIDDAIAAYAPPKENDTTQYQKQVKDALKVSGETRIKELNEPLFEKLVQQIEHIEGFQEGKIEPILKIKAIQKNAHGVIQGYQCGSEWHQKKEAIDLVLIGKLDALHCKTSNGDGYLRARHGNPSLESLPTQKI